MDRLKSAVLIDFGSIFLLHLRQSKEYREIVAKKISGLHSLLFADKKSHLVTLGIFIILVHTYCYPYPFLFFLSSSPPLSVFSLHNLAHDYFIYFFEKKNGYWLLACYAPVHGHALNRTHLLAHARTCICYLIRLARTARQW